jgi:hypothetical protein
VDQKEAKNVECTTNKAGFGEIIKVEISRKTIYSEKADDFSQ